MFDKDNLSVFSILDTVAQDVTRIRGARLAAAIVFKGDIISIGVNEKRSHPLQKKYGRNHDSIYLHAEISAIIGARKRLTPDQFRKSFLYVCRSKFFEAENYLGWGFCFPCTGCRKAISDFNIKSTLYTMDGYGKYGILEPEDTR